MSDIVIDDILDISLKAGVLILENGGETYRAEKTCVKVAKALGAPDASAFVTPTLVIVSAYDNENHCHTAMRRVSLRTVNLAKISQLNDLARRLTARGKQTEPKQAEHLLDRIDKAPRHGNFPLTVMAAFSAFFFAFMFGSNLKEALIAFVIGALLRIVLIFLDKVHVNGFLVSLISGGLISTLCELVLFFGFVPSSVTIMTAVLMQVVPGMAIVNAIRDLLAGDLIAGTARLVDAFMVAAGLSAGSAFGILVFSNVHI